MCNGASVFSWEQSCFSPQYLIHQHPIIQVIQVTQAIQEMQAMKVMHAIQAIQVIQGGQDQGQ